MDDHQGDRGDMGRHSAGNRLCSYCGKAEGDLVGGADPDARVAVLIDLEEYTDEDRIFQGRRTPDNPLGLFLIWCVGCACSMVDEGDPITSFREMGYPDNSPDGPYARYLHRNRGFQWKQHPERP
ncbi:MULTISPECIES: hypothetical protein [unclassified Streptomyces]|uniref:hypothetical protein n=1 Tax=unclassified Streptomyces TaxID=2593676 RepID=UPI0022AF4B7A|nr:MULTISPECIES: hypothetical protein [unclassified Streptomyces]MCZ4097289.1 hypothetical protein [Streptomyces sp. H39-C1]MCZ4120593.1 hypothetical protein [Streptomyces sp. H39-S7]